MKTLAAIAEDLATGRTTSVALTREALARIDDPAGEGKRTFIRRNDAAALAAAEASDALRANGIVPSPIAGVPVSVKDLCDIAGETTTAGSISLADQPPAASDATVVARLRAAGAVIVGTTNMVEFALGGIGLNTHYGTPKNPWDRATGRVPGGSSSGAAVSVTDGMAAAALGTDTAGSVRIPAALCGLTGFKPTARRTPTDGFVPLSTTLDSVGPLAPTVACCALVHAVSAAETPDRLPEMPLRGLRLALPQSLVLDDLDDTVASAFGDALSRLSSAGAQIVEFPFAELDRISGLLKGRSLAIAEGYAWHRKHLARAGDRYDPLIAARFRGGEHYLAADYIDILNGRRALITEADRATAPYDAVVMPAVATVAPTIAEFDNESHYHRINALFLRNTSAANFLDRPSLTLPCQRKGEGPVGLMLVGETMADRRLLGIGQAVERTLR